MPYVGIGLIPLSNQSMGPKMKQTSNSIIFDTLPDGAFVRQSQLVQSPATPAAPLPFSAPTLWRKVKDGTFPKPVKLSARVTAWQVGAVRTWMAGVQS